MFRVLTVAAAIAGTAIGLAPFAGADPALGGADEPGVNCGVLVITQ